MQRELSHTRAFYAGPGEVGVPVGQGMAKFVQRRWLQAAGTSPGRRAVSGDLRSPRSPRASPQGQRRRASARWRLGRDLPFDPGEHLVRRTSSPVLGVSGPADEGQAGVRGPRPRSPASRCPTGSARDARIRRAPVAPTPRQLRSRPASWRRGGRAPCSERLRRVLPPACGIGGKGSVLARGATTKNVARARALARASSTSGVHTGSGPSSKVRAIRAAER